MSAPLRTSTLLVLTMTLVACGKSSGDSATTIPDPVTTTTGSTTDPTEEPLPTEVAVTVTLDGAPIEGAVVWQGGGFVPWTTDASGRVTVSIDPMVPGDAVLIGTHPEARPKASDVVEATLALDLTRFSTVDNQSYSFDPPGTPTDRADNSKCAHCHNTLNDDWYDSMHRQAASNPRVQDVYAGVSAAISDAGSCAAAGGTWWEGLEPGTRAPLDRCYLGAGTLPDLNPGCGVTEPCDALATQTGACADCHAPGIDGALGGRDLLEATGLAYDFGVHCDVCHKVESVDLGAEAGVAGRLKILRPSDPNPSPVFEFQPLTFGPYGDVPNPRMGAVKRDHFQDTSLCAGCHQHEQAVLVPGVAIDTARWPGGELPIHSTWQEWFNGPMNPGAPCQSCHMPPDPDAGNAADLYNVFPAALGEGIASGWPRPPGAVRRHVWVGPRSPDVQDMLGLAALVQLSTRWEGTEWVVDATVRNVGPGHALPTGEPSRQLLLAVEADCGANRLSATGGDVLPDYAGFLDLQDATGDWSQWPGAAVGEVIRVVSRPGGFTDYVGTGPFGDGSFDAVDKGLPIEAFAGERTITAVAGDTVTLDAPLPAGDRAYRLPAVGLPVNGAPIEPLAGSPGFGFAKVLVDAAGNRMVPHHAAVDVVSDNRIPPQQGWTSTHRFDGTGCATPTVRAVLVHRAFPYAQAAEKRWTVTESTMAEVSQ